MQTGMVICGAIGLDTDLSFAYQLFALLACILVAARISLRFQVPTVAMAQIRSICGLGVGREVSCCAVHQVLNVPAGV